MGVLHPDVVHNFELNLPCAILELDVEEFLWRRKFNFPNIYSDAS